MWQSVRASVGVLIAMQSYSWLYGLDEWFHELIRENQIAATGLLIFFILLHRFVWAAERAGIIRKHGEAARAVVRANRHQLDDREETGDG